MDYVKISGGKKLGRKGRRRANRKMRSDGEAQLSIARNPLIRSGPIVLEHNVPTEGPERLAYVEDLRHRIFNDDYRKPSTRLRRRIFTGSGRKEIDN